jgi:hypothetical protein
MPGLRNVRDDAAGNPLTAKTARPPSRRERAKTAADVRRYTESITSGGLTVRWSNLTEREARQLVDLTRSHNRSTRSWWPLVLQGAGVKQQRGRPEAAPWRTE